MSIYFLVYGKDLFDIWLQFLDPHFTLSHHSSFPYIALFPRSCFFTWRDMVRRISNNLGFLLLLLSRMHSSSLLKPDIPSMSYRGRTATSLALSDAFSSSRQPSCPQIERYLASEDKPINHYLIFRSQNCGFNIFKWSEKWSGTIKWGEKKITVYFNGHFIAL